MYESFISKKYFFPRRFKNYWIFLNWKFI